MMKQDYNTAAICGLYCGTCPSYGRECDGCLSDNLAPGCDTCGNGFRACADAHRITRCYECSEFPCSRLEAFSRKHIVNGICHHEHVIEDLNSMKDMGVESWVNKQREQHTCKLCGQHIFWYEKKCPRCEDGRN